MNKLAGPLRTLAAAVLLGPALACAADDPMTQVPGVGDYDAKLCVTVGQATPNCGAAVASWAGGIARVQLGDFVYVLWLYPQRLDVALMQGEMQVQEFRATWQWQGRDRLLFTDLGRNTRYELRLGAMK